MGENFTMKQTDPGTPRLPGRDPDFFPWKITENYVNEANTVNHETLYSHYLRDSE
jgi:hypothetical protein